MTEARSKRRPSTCMSADPEAQAGQDQVAHDGMVAVDRVAAAGEVQIIAVRAEQVVELVVEAAEGIGAAAVVALRRCG